MMWKTALLAAGAALALGACAQTQPTLIVTDRDGFVRLSENNTRVLVVRTNHRSHEHAARREARQHAREARHRGEEARRQGAEARRLAAEVRRNAREQVRLAELSRPSAAEIARITRQAESARAAGEAAHRAGEDARRRVEAMRPQIEALRREAERLREQCERGEIKCEFVVVD
jgi:chromosome segregation ATPase